MIAELWIAIAKWIGLAADEGQQRLKELRDVEASLNKQYGAGNRVQAWTANKEEIAHDTIQTGALVDAEPDRSGERV